MTSAQLEAKFTELEQRLLEKIATLIVGNKPVKSEPPSIIDNLNEIDKILAAESE